MRHQYAPAGIDAGTAEQLSEILQERLRSMLDLCGAAVADPLT
jgi:hypothetical protein